jgi:glucosamine kinase
LGINGGAEGVMDLVIGIDGGGSGCRAAVADRSGRILGEAQGGPANIATDPDAARTALLACARDALASMRPHLPPFPPGLGWPARMPPARRTGWLRPFPFAGFGSRPMR